MARATEQRSVMRNNRRENKFERHTLWVGLECRGCIEGYVEDSKRDWFAKDGCKRRVVVARRVIRRLECS